MTIERLKREVEYEKARSAAAEKREGELKAELEQAKANCDAICQTNRRLNNDILRQVEVTAKTSVLREALAKAAEVFEGYACHHFLKGADEKAQANRAHAKMCHDALSTDEK